VRVASCCLRCLAQVSMLATSPPANETRRPMASLSMPRVGLRCGPDDDVGRVGVDWALTDAIEAWLRPPGVTGCG
jgi:hypothetical protein